MKHILIKSIPHKNQSYDTCGNYRMTPKSFQITVSKMGNEDFEFLVGLHETVEQYLCYKEHIFDDVITKFDKVFEAKRKKGNTDEPGDDPKAPYYDQHQFATKIERMMAKMLGVSWKKYEEAINSL